MALSANIWEVEVIPSFRVIDRIRTATERAVGYDRDQSLISKLSLCLQVFWMLMYHVLCTRHSTLQRLDLVFSNVNKEAQCTYKIVVAEAIEDLVRRGKALSLV